MHRLLYPLALAFTLFAGTEPLAIVAALIVVVVAIFTKKQAN
jgi:hypothetical protein